ncbi:MAG TPA: AraC family transcriptional regulator [Sphingobacteriaceae bacterium]
MTIAKRLRNKNEIVLGSSTRTARTVDAENLTMTLVLSGSEQVDIGRKNINLYPGNFLVLPQGARYSRLAQSDEPVTSLSLSFSPGFIREFCNKQDAEESIIIGLFGHHDPNQMPVWMFPFRNDFRYTVLNLKRNLEQGLLDDSLLNQYLFHCLLNYYRIFRKEVLEKTGSLSFSNPVTRNDIMKRLVLAKDFIQSNYDRKIGLKDVAREACLSVNHLLRTFQQVYHKSPHQYLLQVRFERARYLLLNTESSVKEIAGRVGFDCPSSFIRHFRSTFSETPAHYRKNRTKV